MTIIEECLDALRRAGVDLYTAPGSCTLVLPLALSPIWIESWRLLAIRVHDETEHKCQVA